MIDQIEKIAIDYVGFENFLDLTKTQTLKDLKDIEDILAGRKTEEPTDSTECLPTISTKRQSGAGSGYNSTEEKEKDNESDQNFIKGPTMRYNHDSGTYHMG